MSIKIRQRIYRETSTATWQADIHVKLLDGRKIREALENLGTKVEGVVTTYDKPFSTTDHEAITSNIPVLGTVKGGRVVPANPADIEGDKALRIKTKS